MSISYSKGGNYLLICASVSALFILCTLPIFAQPNQQLSRRELHYKLRDGNRWEGVKSRLEHKVSDNLKLASLIVCDDKWRQQNTPGSRDSAAIFFSAPAVSGIIVSVFELGKLYYMDPDSKKFGKSGRHSFKWPAKILNAIKLPENQLEALAQAKIENREAYFPIYFRPPDKAAGKLIFEFALMPDKDMTFDLMLLAGDADQPIYTWPNVSAKRYELKLFTWPLDVKFAKQKNFTLIALEKTGSADNKSKRRHDFYIYFSQ